MSTAPQYINLYESGELETRITRAVDSLETCTVCPWECRINRLGDERRICRTGRYARVTSYFPHHGEEDCLRGRKGSGTIFFGACNLRCVFCQNYDISQKDSGREVTSTRLARMMLVLQEQGCHNINLVSPEHVVPQVLEALIPAIEGGLRLPIVYNTSGFDSMESLRLLDGIVDIYLPDFKYWSSRLAKKYLKNADYPAVVRKVLKEMYRQVGVLQTDEEGIAARGLLVRHLLMPGGQEETRAILKFIATEISPEITVNIMGQYRPAGEVNDEHYPELNCRIPNTQLAEAYRWAGKVGLTHLI